MRRMYVWELTLPLISDVIVVRENRSHADYHCLRLWCRIARKVITSSNHDGEMARQACFSSLIHLGTQEPQLTTRLITL